jgi:hypothetical protein
MCNAMSHVCKQNQSLLSSHLHENCMVKFLQPRGSVRPSCDKYVVEISNSIWTQLRNNKWIYFVPTSDNITIVCMAKSLVDVIVSGIGKLGISAIYKGFGQSGLFQARSILNVDNPGCESDFMSGVNLEYDCCEELNMKYSI